MARPSSPLFARTARRTTATVRAALLASAVVTLAACSSPTAPEPPGDAPASYRPLLGGGAAIDPDRSGGNE